MNSEKGVREACSWQLVAPPCDGGPWLDGASSQGATPRHGTESPSTSSASPGLSSRAVQIQTSSVEKWKQFESKLVLGACVNSKIDRLGREACSWQLVAPPCDGGPWLDWASSQGATARHGTGSPSTSSAFARAYKRGLRKAGWPQEDRSISGRGVQDTYNGVASRISRNGLKVAVALGGCAPPLAARMRSCGWETCGSSALSFAAGGMYPAASE